MFTPFTFAVKQKQRWCWNQGLWRRNCPLHRQLWHFTPLPWSENKPKSLDGSFKTWEPSWWRFTLSLPDLIKDEPVNSTVGGAGVAIDTSCPLLFSAWSQSMPSIYHKTKMLRAVKLLLDTSSYIWRLTCTMWLSPWNTCFLTGVRHSERGAGESTELFIKNGHFVFLRLKLKTISKTVVIFMSPKSELNSFQWLDVIMFQTLEEF